VRAREGEKRSLDSNYRSDSSLLLSSKPLNGSTLRTLNQVQRNESLRTFEGVIVFALQERGINLPRRCALLSSRRQVERDAKSLMDRSPAVRNI
jgi:hypothetical protein